jgi:hypothetical protein
VRVYLVCRSVSLCLSSAHAGAAGQARFELPAQRSVWRLAAALPEPAGDDAAAACLAALAALRGDAARAATAGPMLECLVAWARQKPLLARVRAGLRALLPPTDAAAADAAGGGRKAAGGKRARGPGRASEEGAGEEEGGGRGGGPPPPPGADNLGWCAHYLVAHDATRRRLLLSPSQVQAVREALAAALPLVASRARGCGGGGAAAVTDEQALDLLLTYGKYCLHLHCAAAGAPAAAAAEPVADLLAWCREEVAPRLAERARPAAAAGGEGGGKKTKKRGGKAEAGGEGAAPSGGGGRGVALQAFRQVGSQERERERLRKR